jgi:hypothetical protein
MIERIAPHALRSLQSVIGMCVGVCNGHAILWLLAQPRAQRWRALGNCMLESVKNRPKGALGVLTCFSVHSDCTSQRALRTGLLGRGLNCRAQHSDA